MRAKRESVQVAAQCNTRYGGVTQRGVNRAAAGIGEVHLSSASVVSEVGRGQRRSVDLHHAAGASVEGARGAHARLARAVERVGSAHAIDAGHRRQPLLRSPRNTPECTVGARRAENRRSAVNLQPAAGAADILRAVGQVGVGQPVKLGRAQPARRRAMAGGVGPVDLRDRVYLGRGRRRLRANRAQG